MHDDKLLYSPVVIGPSILTYIADMTGSSLSASFVHFDGLPYCLQQMGPQLHYVLQTRHNFSAISKIRDDDELPYEPEQAGPHLYHRQQTHRNFSPTDKMGVMTSCHVHLQQMDPNCIRDCRHDDTSFEGWMQSKMASWRTACKLAYLVVYVVKTRYRKWLV